MPGRTQLTIHGREFHINGIPTYSGRVFRDSPVEGLLMNARVVNAIFDDRNPQTVGRWVYPDTGTWDPERNLAEFLAQLPIWRQHGLLAITVNMQGGSPEGYSRTQPWDNSGFEPNGDLRPDYLSRLDRVLEEADHLGMVVIVGLFYQGQDERMADESAIRRAVDNISRWLLARGTTNAIVEIANECDVLTYEHVIFQPWRIHELIAQVRDTVVNGRRLLVGTSFRGGQVPSSEVAAMSDLLLVHGNRVTDPNHMATMVDRCRALTSARPMPIVVNEDDHFDFDKPWNNMLAAISRGASWGYFDAGPGSGGAGFQGNYVEGFQNVPVNWTMNTDVKRGFFRLLQEVTRG
jgi:hypothetical protein